MSTDKLTSWERRRLARAIRGDIPRCAPASDLRAQLLAKGLDPEAVEVMVEALGVRRGEQLRLF
jgi:hypothetical protein